MLCSFFQLGKKKSLVYVVNGILLATVFLFCRVLVYPYMYWCYSKYSSVPFLKTPFRIPLFCNAFCFVLMSLQVYWFVAIARGVLQFVSKLRSTSSVPVVKEHGKNGFFHKTHELDGNPGVTVSKKIK